MTRRTRGRLSFLLALGLAGISCVDDVGQGPKAEPVGLALRATVAGLNSAVGYTVSVQVGYQLAGGGSALLDIEPSSFQITSENPPVAQRIRVDLTRCLEDAARAGADTDACRLSVTLSLSDATGELAQATQDLGLVRDGDQVEPPEPIAITPSFVLAITGGGAGTGSGVVSVPAAGGQLALSCQITDGQAAATGCSGRYPLHTALTLTASGATLETWEGDCAASSASDSCLLTMDGHRTASARFLPAATTGELEVQVSGLPAGVAAQVIVANTTGFNRLVTEATVLSGLLPGEYTVTAGAVAVPAEGRTYNPDPLQQTVAVAVGQRTTAQIGYNPPETGSLAVAITGLPEGIAASVNVTGPNGFSQALTAAQTLAGLEPGVYTVTAQDVETSDQIYAPTPLTQTQTVAANGTVPATVAYAASRASLTVVISGLPTGLAGSVTVTGPNEYRQDLTVTTAPPLGKLTPGTYTVTASSVIGGTEETYEPVVAPAQPILINAGGSATVTVVYGVRTPVKLIFTEQPTNVTAGEVISPAVKVEIRDALDRPVSGYAASVTLELQGGNSDATLGGTRTVIPRNGVATFSDLPIDKAGDGYTLLATSGILPPATSAPFNVLAGAPAAIVVTVDTDNLEVGQSGQATAVVTDALGNVVPTAPVSWTSSNEAVATVTPTSGSSTVTWLAVGQGTAELTASTGDLSSAGVSVQVVLVDLGTIGGPGAVAQKVNSSLVIVGYGPNASGQRRAFAWLPDRGMAELSLPGYEQSAANSLNEAGQVVGFGVDGEGVSRAILWSPAGAPQDLGTLGGCCSAAFDINNAGAAVGNARTGEQSEHAFIWNEANGMIDLGILPGTSSSNAYGINDRGEVVGVAQDKGLSRAFLWSHVEGMRDLGGLVEGSSSVAQDINNSGQVVGYSFTSSGAPHAFLWTSEGGMRDLGTLAGGSSSVAHSINDRGMVVGYSVAGDGRRHAFLWTSTAGMVDLGILSGGRGSVAFGVSPEGHVVGSSFNASGVERAVRFR